MVELWGRARLVGGLLLLPLVGGLLSCAQAPKPTRLWWLLSGISSRGRIAAQLKHLAGDRSQCQDGLRVLSAKRVCT